MRATMHAVLVLLAMTTTAHPRGPLDEPDKRFLCISEASGGIKNIGGSWIGTGFQNDDKVLITPTKKNIFTDNPYVILDPGKKLPITSCNIYKDGTQLYCDTYFYNGFFSTETLRLQLIYKLGYAQPGTINDTPNITGFRCSPI
ncbi:hypothetical protein [Breoghania sp. JC706]|uniref:hypothetical protein n=1 Tax=Breoghania sp. JC706 TaxID=3117732 RepID=UPI00300A0237